MKRIVFAIMALTLAGLLLLSGCGNQQATKEANEKVIVAVTVLPQKAFVEAVCGDLAEIVTIVPPGTSPGNYEPTPQEMERFSKAAVYFTIGVPTEKANILPRAESMKIVSMPERVAEVYPDREFSEGKRDPHIWLSPKRAKVMIQLVADTMCELDAESAETYNKNAEAFLKEIDQADTKIKETFSGIQNLKFIVFHPAYGYFADDYGLTMNALEENGKEATPQHLQDMIDLAKTENIKTIFSQAEIDSNQPEAFAEEIGGEKVMLSPLSDDYIANLKSMAEALAGAMK